jgi:methylated-DNA-[protein]-cysteine S-methyltransferase
MTAPANEPVDALRSSDPTRGTAAPDVGGLAVEHDLFDVVYRTVDSPLGRLLLAATPTGLAHLAYLRSSPEEEVLDRLVTAHGPRIIRAPRALDDVARQVDEYLAGRRRRFDLDLDLSAVGPFGRRVLEVATHIPPGEVRTYSEVAAEAGTPKGARAAGNALGANPIPIVVPCHRVVRRGGALGGYTGGLDIKRRLLELEGFPTP